MNIIDIIEIIKACIRPYIAVSIVTVIVALAIIFALRFGDADMAKQIFTFILATGATVTGFYFGERATKK